MSYMEITLYIIAVFLAFTEIPTFLTYGGFISGHIAESLMHLNEGELRLNMYNPSILATTPYISTHGSVFSKYHVENLGVVFRWSKLHKRIEEYYAIAIKNQINKTTWT